MNTSILKSFDLNRNDILVYETLLKIGRSKTGPIIRNSLVGSSRVYESLRILVSRGLVSYQVRNNIKYYQKDKADILICDSSIEIQKTEEKV